MNLNVTLINKQDFENNNFFRKWGEFSAICYNSPLDKAINIGKACLKSGHFSGSRHIYFAFHVDLPRSCYDSQTEILTKDGWKYFKDLKDSEIVATRNWDSGQVEFHPINEKIEYNYSGDMYDLKSQAVNLSITQNHNVFYKKPDIRVDKDKLYLSPIGDITFNKLRMNKEFEYNPPNKINSIFRVEGYKYKKKTKTGYCEMTVKDLYMQRDDFYKLFAWYLSDGSTYYCKKENKYVISISQTNCEENIKNKTKKDIADVIKRLGFAPVTEDVCVKFNSLALGRFFKKLGLCNEKYIPFNIYDNFDAYYAKVFLKEYFRGDGHIDKNGCGKFYTTSKVLAGQLQELCFVAGWTAMVYKRGHDLVGTTREIDGRLMTINHIGYCVNVSFKKRNRNPYINLKKHLTINKSIKTRVYCVNVKNNVIFVRRNGKAIWCGNCADQIVRHEQGVVKNVQSQRYVSKDKFDYYTSSGIANNQEVKNVYESQMLETQKAYNEIIDILKDCGISGEKANEQARGVLPMDCESKMAIAFNIEALIHLCHKRLCSRTQEHTRKIVKMIANEVIQIIPELKEYLVPHCEYLLWCPEGNHGKDCPRRTSKAILSKEEVKEIISRNK